MGLVLPGSPPASLNSPCLFRAASISPLASPLPLPGFLPASAPRTDTWPSFVTTRVRISFPSQASKQDTGSHLGLFPLGCGSTAWNALPCFSCNTLLGCHSLQGACPDTLCPPRSILFASVGPEPPSGRHSAFLFLFISPARVGLAWRTVGLVKLLQD